METGRVGNLPISDAAGKILYAIGERVPDASLLFRAGVGGCFDRVALDDERVQVYHGDMVVEEVEDGGACDAGGQRCDVCED